MIASSVCRACNQLKDLSSFEPKRAVCRACRAADKRQRRADVARSKVPQPSIRAPDLTAARGGDTDKLQLLFKLTKKNGVLFSDLCDQLDVSPSRAKALIEQAKALGLQMQIEHNHVGVQLERRDERLRDVVAPVKGQRQMVGVISDTHLGSKYCLREQLKEFVTYAYNNGVREILHPGDILDGDYRHGKFEMSHMGLEEQVNDLIETLPHLPGLTYHAIAGNHDFTFTEGSGVDVTRFIERRFRDEGRNDFFAYGDRSAFLKVRGAVIHLWHPKKGTGYARSYAIQKEIESYSSLKPQVLLIGHWHVFCHIYERNVHGIACPTFQGGGSAFSKSLGGTPAIGGLILSWDLTENNTMRSFTVEKRSYVERETIYNPFNDVDAIQI